MSCDQLLILNCGVMYCGICPLQNYITVVSVAPKMLHSMKDVLYYLFHNWSSVATITLLWPAALSTMPGSYSWRCMLTTTCTYQAKSDSVFKEYFSFFAVSLTISCLCIFPINTFQCFCSEHT